MRANSVPNQGETALLSTDNALPLSIVI